MNRNARILGQILFILGLIALFYFGKKDVKSTKYVSKGVYKEQNF